MVSTATATANRFDYQAIVSNSVFDSSRSLQLMMPNQKAITSNYTASVLFEKNAFLSANVTPPTTIPSTSSGADGENIANLFLGAISGKQLWLPAALVAHWCNGVY